MEQHRTLKEDIIYEKDSIFNRSIEEWISYQGDKNIYLSRKYERYEQFK